MRAYFFGNMYLSSIQQGIQAAHVTHELFMKSHGEDATFTLLEWASNHKTMILLNAGYSEELHSLVEFFGEEDNPYPWAFFNEGKDALDGALTCVGVVLPERVYELAANIREFGILNATMVALDEEDFKPYDIRVAERLNMYGLAK